MRGLQLMENLNELRGVDSVASSVEDTRINAVLEELGHSVHLGSWSRLEPTIAFGEEPGSNPWHVDFALLQLPD